MPHLPDPRAARGGPGALLEHHRTPGGGRQQPTLRGLVLRGAGQLRPDGAVMDQQRDGRLRGPPGRRRCRVRRRSVTLRVLGEVAAGPRRPLPRAAIRIMTGAMMPDGADTVVPVEDTDAPAGASTSATVAIFAPVRPGRPRPPSRERRGKAVRPPPRAPAIAAAIALLAATGTRPLSVHRRPRVSDLDRRTKSWSRRSSAATGPGPATPTRSRSRPRRLRPGPRCGASASPGHAGRPAGPAPRGGRLGGRRRPEWRRLSQRPRAT